MAIAHPIGGSRIIAEILPTPAGFVYADVGWDDRLQSGHPFHRVDGLASRHNGTVRFDLGAVGTAEVMELVPGGPGGG